MAKHNKVQTQLNSAFNNVDVPTRVIQPSINLITSRRLVNLVLGIRKHFAGLLLGVIKKVKSVPYINNEGNFGESITLLVPCLIITKNVLKTHLHVIMMTTMIKRMMTTTKHIRILIKRAKIYKTIKLPCTDNCKQLTDFEKKTIVELKAAFSKNVDDFRQILQDVDSGCPHKHEADKQGHPLICYEENSGCTSSLRILSSLPKIVHFSSQYL